MPVQGIDSPSHKVIDPVATSSFIPLQPAFQVLAYRCIEECHQYLVRSSPEVAGYWEEAYRLVQSAEAIRQFHQRRYEPLPNLPFLWLEKGGQPTCRTPTQCLHFFSARHGTCDFPGEAQSLHQPDFEAAMDRKRQWKRGTIEPEALLDAAATAWVLRPFKEKYARKFPAAASESATKPVEVRYTLTTTILGKPPPWAAQQCQRCGTALLLWCETCSPPPVAPASAPDEPAPLRRRRLETEGPPLGRPPKTRRVGGGRGSPSGDGPPLAVVGRGGVVPNDASPGVRRCSRGDPFSSLLSLATVAVSGGWREEVKSDSEEEEEEMETSDSEADDPTVR
eukprot:GGOE01036544.1.p1 GENE.GGOE01036544.1~~GGOE01036544.1.p1  ORF type:complete len:337 (+),score=74.37 GGOE01036544.1:113-1123(+)